MIHKIDEAINSLCEVEDPFMQMDLGDIPERQSISSLLRDKMPTDPGENASELAKMDHGAAYYLWDYVIDLVKASVEEYGEESFEIDDITDGVMDRIYELASEWTPDYYSDMWKVSMESSDISHRDIDIGMLGDSPTLVDVMQLAIREYNLEKLDEEWETIKTEIEDVIE